MPGTVCVAGAQMNVIGLVIAPCPDPHAAQRTAIIDKGGKIHSGPKLDEAAIIASADITCHAGSSAAVNGDKLQIAVRHAAHHAIAEKTPVVRAVRRHLKGHGIVTCMRCRGATAYRQQRQTCGNQPAGKAPAGSFAAAQRYGGGFARVLFHDLKIGHPCTCLKSSPRQTAYRSSKFCKECFFLWPDNQGFGKISDILATARNGAIMQNGSGKTLPAIQATLAASGLAFEVWPCDDDLADTAAFCAHYQVPSENSVNAILVRDKADGDNHALCMVPATHRLDVNKTVRKRLGAKKASFATLDETRAITGMEIGGVTPIGLPAGVRVWVEESVMALDYIILGGGNRTSKLKVPPSIFLQITDCEIVAELARLRD